jgi:hypothetical protein
VKIHRLLIKKIDHRPLLNGLEMFFYPSEIANQPNCFIGVNGSGKSQVLETLAEIFYYLDRIYGNPANKTMASTPLLF